MSRTTTFGLAMALLGLGISPSQAATITAVTAPNLVRPTDNVAYPFLIQVSGTYNAFDIALAGPIAWTAHYIDDDPIFDDPIDLTGAFFIPAAPAAAVAGVTVWGPVAVTFSVGCTAGSIVFGPSGGTGEGPVMDDGYFHFPSDGFFGSDWGYNTVTCNPALPAPVPPGAPPPPYNPAPPWPGLVPVPEPAAWQLGMLGTVCAVAMHRRRRSR